GVRVGPVGGRERLGRLDDAGVGERLADGGAAVAFRHDDLDGALAGPGEVVALGLLVGEQRTDEDDGAADEQHEREGHDEERHDVLAPLGPPAGGLPARGAGGVGPRLILGRLMEQIRHAWFSFVRSLWVGATASPGGRPVLRSRSRADWRIMTAAT